MSNQAPTVAPSTGRITLAQRFAWFGGKVLDMAEYIGEGVVSVLGKTALSLSLKQTTDSDVLISLQDWMIATSKMYWTT
jgi:hypothetical protein